MHALPPELHTQIFELACADDGSTARSLALVSHYVRDLAAPFFYQSLAVAGLGPMAEFLTRLERVPAQKRRVRRLFLSDRSRKQMQQKCAPISDADMDRYDLEKCIIVRILDLVAPTLHSLAFLVSCPLNSTQLISHLFSLRLPHLRDLSIHGFYPFPHLPGVMPCVEHLHLSGNRNPHGLFQVGALDVACPQVTRLRISGLVSAPSFAEELEEALQPDSGNHTTRSLFSAALPPHIGQIIVQVGPAPTKARRYASASAQHDKMSERLEAITRADSSNRVRLTVADRHDGDVYKSMYSAWAQETL